MKALQEKEGIWGNAVAKYINPPPRNPYTNLKIRIYKDVLRNCTRFDFTFYGRDEEFHYTKNASHSITGLLLKNSEQKNIAIKHMIEAVTHDVKQEIDKINKPKTTSLFKGPRMLRKSINWHEPNGHQFDAFNYFTQSTYYKQSFNKEETK